MENCFSYSQKYSSTSWEPLYSHVPYDQIQQRYGTRALQTRNKKIALVIGCKQLCSCVKGLYPEQWQWYPAKAHLTFLGPRPWGVGICGREKDTIDYNKYSGWRRSALCHL